MLLRSLNEQCEHPLLEGALLHTFDREWPALEPELKDVVEQRQLTTPIATPNIEDRVGDLLVTTRRVEQMLADQSHAIHAIQALLPGVQSTPSHELEDADARNRTAVAELELRERAFRGTADDLTRTLSELRATPPAVGKPGGALAYDEKIASLEARIADSSKQIEALRAARNILERRGAR